MAKIPGTNVSSTVVPFDDKDNFATHEAKYGKGGHRTLNSITERNTISRNRRELLMTVGVVEDGKTYKLISHDPIKDTTTEENWLDISVTGATKDVLIIINPVTIGAQNTEILFPYKGKIKRLISNVPSDTVITKDLVINTECWQGGSWKVVGVVTIKPGETKAITELVNDFTVDYDVIRVNVSSCQSGIPSMSNIATIY